MVYHFQMIFTSQDTLKKNNPKLENKKQEVKLQKDYNDVCDLNYYVQNKTCPSSFQNINNEKNHCGGVLYIIVRDLIFDRQSETKFLFS